MGKKTELVCNQSACRLRFVGMLFLLLGGGCQGLGDLSVVPGAESRRERQIVRQAENDPFPSPSDVGMRLPE